MSKLSGSEMRYGNRGRNRAVLTMLPSRWMMDRDCCFNFVYGERADFGET